MKKWNTVLGKVTICVCEIIVGILLMADPVVFTAGIITAAGILLLLTGAFTILRYFRMDPLQAQLEQGLVKGICAILCGLLCIFKREWIITTFPLLTVLYGLIILFTGIMRVQWAVDMMRIKKEQWQMAGAGAAVSIVLAAVILLNPFKTTVVLWRFVAVSMIIGAVMDLVILVFIKQGNKEYEEQNNKTDIM
ncbi:MAG: DUF308 domain-containing protein [Lachnospiraceae bacterium]|nr:DUF308 domain-containing protein [Lachnospiraceae bacterium]